MTDQDFLAAVDAVAATSEDTGAHVGAVIGYNGHQIISACNELPTGVIDSPERRARPAKYLFTEHAERNAILKAARYGHKTAGAAMYQRWFPCADCARAIIQAGIVRIVCQQPNFEDPRWGESFKAAYSMLTEVNVAIEYY